MVLDAAGLLEISEFKVFELAFVAWHGPQTENNGPNLEKIFSAYMYSDIVPVWVRSFTRNVIERAKSEDFSPEEFGIVAKPPSATMVYLGIRYAVWVSLTLAALIIGVQFLDPETAGHCFFPPCY